MQQVVRVPIAGVPEVTAEERAGRSAGLSEAGLLYVKCLTHRLPVGRAGASGVSVLDQWTCDCHSKERVLSPKDC